MAEPCRYKYAIVRVKETSVVDFFGLIAANGYSDVSFVSNLSQAIARPDPNNDDDTPSNGKSDERAVDSEDRFSVAEGTPQSPPTVEEGDRKTSNLSSHLALMVGNQGLGNGNVQAGEATGDLAAAASTDLISNLFATHTIPMTAREWSSELNDAGGPMRSPQFKQMVGTGREQFQTRMKGWQREYIKDVINNGHYPTEEEMRDIEQKCDLSRKQVLRFISKRLSNPNRKPRADWRSDRAAESVSPMTEIAKVKSEDSP